MRRASAIRLLGGFVTVSLAGCDSLDCSIPVPLLNGSSTGPTTFGSQIYVQDDVERSLALIAGCGGSIVRIQINGKQDFADAVFAAAARRGMRVLVVTDFAKQPVDVAAFAAATAAVQQRYAHYDPIWEIWNEPNLAFYWGEEPNVPGYTRLAIETAKALRAAGAHDVWTGGTSGLDLEWISKIKALGIFDYMNGCAVHSYEDPCLAQSHYGMLVGLVPKNIPIHTTETCISSPSTQSDFLREMWYIHRELGIPTMIWCELRDGTAGTKGQFAFPYGLVYKNYNLKPIYLVAQQIIA